MLLNYNNKTIELSSKEAKAAAKIGSEDYKKLLAIREANPNYEVVVITRKSTSKKRFDSLKGLNFTYMEKYINTHAPEKADDFFAIRNACVDDLKVKGASYGEIKKWFLAQFPEFLEAQANVDKILSNIKVSA